MRRTKALRRAALAQWLTDPANALTWRSIVNRVWHHHFGRGLVETPNDFGKMGSAPSHPELLDWLAVWFRDDAKGSLKALHRLIVTSATYRQASSPGIAYRVSESAAATLKPRYSITRNAADSENRLLSRMNRTRLDADQVRDAILQISGALDLRMGGPSDMQFDLQPGHHVTPKVDYTKFDVDSPAGAPTQRLSLSVPHAARSVHGRARLSGGRSTHAGAQFQRDRAAGARDVERCLRGSLRGTVGATSRNASVEMPNEQIRLACELALSRPPTDDRVEGLQRIRRQAWAGEFLPRPLQQQ